MRILLIEDDSVTAKNLELILKSEGFVCDTTDLGEDGLEIGKIYDYDLMIIDLMLPDIDGLEVVKRLRSSKVKTPVLVLSGLDQTEDKVKSLGAGADDYLTKPFSRTELIARIHAIIRRSHGHANSVITTGRLNVNLHKRIATVDGNILALTSKEYAIIELMSLRKGTTLTKEIFLNHLYGGIDEPELKIIDVFVCKLRKKIADALGDDGYIQTIWGRGYVLQNPEHKNNVNSKEKKGISAEDLKKSDIKINQENYMLMNEKFIKSNQKNLQF